MIHNEHLRKADELYEVWHDNNGNAIHMYIKDGEVIIFPNLLRLVEYVILGNSSTERVHMTEDKLDKIPDDIRYNYYSVRDWASKSVLEDIFVTAIEGGCNYWLCFNEDDINKIRSDGKPFAIALLDAVIDGMEIPLYDVNDGSFDQKIGTLSLTRIMDGINNMIKDPVNSKFLENILNETYDAADADCVFQYLTLGEIVYG